MSTLSKATLHNFDNNTAPLSRDEAEQRLQQLPDWRIEEHDGELQLRRDYTFKNFAQALDFANRVGALAEQVDHHPAITVEWGKTRVSWWTHSIGGLHDNDFVMAARSDEIN